MRLGDNSLEHIFEISLSRSRLKVLLTNLDFPPELARPPWLGQETRAHQVLQAVNTAHVDTGKMMTGGTEIGTVEMAGGSIVGGPGRAAQM